MEETPVTEAVVAAVAEANPVWLDFIMNFGATEWFGVAIVVVGALAAVAKLTKTTVDDQVVSYLQKFLGFFKGKK